MAFRVDTSPGAGSGHLVRCLALAQELRSRGAETQSEEKSPVEAADWLVVDHYGLDATWESSMRDKAAKILAIDDLADRKHDCDVLLDQNFFPDAQTRYDGLVPERCRRLLGPRYALMRPEFAALRENLRVRDGTVRRVLVSFGGLDAGNETSKALQVLQRHALEVDVVVGEANPHAEDIRRRCEAHSRFRFHRQPSNMAELMVAADLAVGAGGTTTWERCCLGLPTLQIAIAANQEALSRALAEAGIVTYLRDSLTQQALQEALSNPLTLRQQSERMRALVDGAGRHRVAAAMLASPNSRLQLRDARPDDVRLYFDWASDREVREQSFDSRPLLYEEHAIWFGKRLSDAVLLVAEEEAGVPVGQVRFERAAAHGWRINYSIGAEFRGAGLAAKMLDLAIKELRRRFPGAGLRAEVKTANAASRRVFASLGFTEVSEVMFELSP